ncbi:MAG: thiamine pyrophosphate-dependent dehydrogenase E1 component subunit alpha [Oligoflexia bacterium]|nr:thiamine pyrophosphate-dependent dehydrogenase E1 component subunit alpha [Oligoflexia bacterium]
MTKISLPSSVSLNTQFSLLERMIRVREFEETVATRYSEQEMRCPVHLSVGQEAPPSGLCEALAEKDQIFSHHRSHGHYVAKGGSLKKLISEFYGKATGCTRGVGGSMHAMDVDAGIIACTPIVGGIMPVAVGSAMAHKYDGNGIVTAVFLGDATLEEGVVHESFNFASLKKLPIIFFCENNFFSVYTHLRDRQPDRPLVDLAAAHKMDVYSVDGNDAVEVFRVSQLACESIRKGNGPVFIEAITYRWREHCGPNYDNDIGYRTEEEFQEWKKKCPVEKLTKQLLLEDKDAEEKIKKIHTKIRKEIEDAFQFALESPFPAKEELFKNLYAN